MSKILDRSVPLRNWAPSQDPAAPGFFSKPGYQEIPEPLPAHAGLWLDRCLVEKAEDLPRADKSEEESFKTQPGRRALYSAATQALRPGTPAERAYRTAYERWKRVSGPETAGFGVERHVVEFEACDRLALHPAADATVTGSGLLLHHTYGVPYLPGSALKGVCRARTLRRYGERVADDVFGSVDEGRRKQARDRDEDNPPGASMIDFWDALWIPGSPKDRGPILLDVVTPHHKEYYTATAGRVRQSPDGRSDPTPVLTLSVARGTAFRVVIEAFVGPGRVQSRWLDWVMGILEQALRDDGVGARTGSGYGRMRRYRAQGDAPQNKLAAEQPVVVEAHLTFLPNDGTLTASHSGGKRIHVGRADSSRFLGELSQTARDRLKARRPVRVWLTLGPGGQTVHSIRE